MSKLSFGLLGEFETILPDEEKQSPEVYLKGIDRAVLLKLASFMLGFDPANSPYYDWRKFLRMWFRSDNQQFVQKVWDNCSKLEHRLKERVSLYYNIAALRFFEFAFSLAEGEVTQSEAESEINIFKAYLTFVSKSTEHHTKSKNFIDAQDSKLHAVLILLNMMYPTADLENYDQGDIFITQVVKATILFEWLENNQQAQPLLQAFYQHFNLTHWRDYFQAIIPIVKAHTDSTREGWMDLVVRKDENYKKNTQFLDAFALQSFDMEQDADFKLLRGNPIYRVEEGRYSIISPLFVVEKIYKGLFFQLKEINEALPAADKIVNFRSFYTTHFTENVLLYTLMKYIYGKRGYTRFSGAELAVMGIAGAPDYYIRNGNHLFLLENKDIFINADIKRSGDMEPILAEFQKKLYFEQKKNTATPKAVMQLAANVRRALTMSNPFDTNYKAKNIHIYPILVLHDPSFNAPGLNHLLNYWFDQELAKMKADGINVDRVKKITIINIDTIILYSEYLKQKKETLDNLIIAYHKSQVPDPKKEYKDENHLKRDFGNKHIPFSVSIDHHTQVGFKRLGKGILNDVMKKIFGGQ